MKHFWVRDRVALAITLLILVLPLALAGWYVIQKHRWAQDRLQELEPRYARMLGMEKHADDLEKARNQARSTLAQYTYPASRDVSQAGNDAQQRVRNIFSAAGLEIVSSQVMPAKTEKSFDRIPLAVRTEGELLALQTALVGLTGQSPAILVDGVAVQTIGAVKADKPQRLGVQFNLSVLREQP
jgi:general secretion pathway protein M